MDKEKRIKEIWKYLNEEGIFNIDDLKEGIKNVKQVNITPFVQDLKEATKC